MDEECWKRVGLENTLETGNKEIEKVSGLKSMKKGSFKPEYEIMTSYLMGKSSMKRELT